ncbi:MAG: hypothetical protein O7C75_20135 [Verrucomicrobia bacterium]|nr:hypothetical protein [Verrucomicrobiota bacterium]
MNLSDAQKEAIAGWVAEGSKISDIQSRINETFELSLTYMDVRFLIDDLDLVIKDQPKPIDSDLRNTPAQPPEPEIAKDSVEGEMMSKSPVDGEGVSVSLHRIYKPGSVASGDVVFSDGQQADWSLDQIGRLSLNPATKGYQPDETNLQNFQKKLSVLLQNQDY